MVSEACLLCYSWHYIAADDVWIALEMFEQLLNSGSSAYGRRYGWVSVGALDYSTNLHNAQTDDSGY